MRTVHRKKVFRPGVLEYVSDSLTVTDAVRMPMEQS